MPYTVKFFRQNHAAIEAFSADTYVGAIQMAKARTEELSKTHGECLSYSIIENGTGRVMMTVPGKR